MASVRLDAFEVNLVATRPAFASAFEELRRQLDAFHLGRRTRFGVELVFEEVVSNVLRHGGRPDRVTHVSVKVAPEEAAVRLTFLDDGPPFDPRGWPEPPPAQVGGRGLMLIRSVSSGMEYLRTPEGQNRLTVSVPSEWDTGA